MYLNVPQVNDIIYCDGCASDSSSQGVLFSIASIILICNLESALNPTTWPRTRGALLL
jgi:hypothetical protein